VLEFLAWEKRARVLGMGEEGWFDGGSGVL